MGIRNKIIWSVSEFEQLEVENTGKRTWTEEWTEYFILQLQVFISHPSVTLAQLFFCLSFFSPVRWGHAQPGVHFQLLILLPMFKLTNDDSWIHRSRRCQLHKQCRGHQNVGNQAVKQNKLAKDWIRVRCPRCSGSGCKDRRSIFEWLESEASPGQWSWSPWKTKMIYFMVSVSKEESVIHLCSTREPLHRSFRATAVPWQESTDRGRVCKTITAFYRAITDGTPITTKNNDIKVMKNMLSNKSPFFREIQLLAYNMTEIIWESPVQDECLQQLKIMRDLEIIRLKS